MSYEIRSFTAFRHSSGIGWPLSTTYPGPPSDMLSVSIAHWPTEEQWLPVVEVGPEPGRIRYAFPDAGFSAVFHQRPNAMLTNANATDGVTITVRGLGIQDATDYSTTIMCMSWPEPLPDDTGGSFARNQIEGFKATDIREVQLDGRRGFEGVLSKPSSHMIMRTVDVDRGGCTITAEYPPQLATSYEQQARAFLDTFTLGGFEG